MSILPANVGRVSNLLTSQLLTSNITRTSLALLNLQTQLATGRAVNRASDDPARAAGIAALNTRLRLHEQRFTNLGNAGDVLDTLDSTLTEGNTQLDRIRSLASSQIGVNSDATGRAQSVVQVDSYLQDFLRLANTSFAGLHLFGGSTPGTRPVEQFGGGYRYTARGGGLLTDIGLGDTVPITLGGSNAIGETSSRVRGQPVLDPNLTGGTKIDALNGARGIGVSLGSIDFQFNGGPVGTVNLTGAQSVQDVVTRLAAAIRQYEADNSVTVLGPGGISLSGTSISMDIPAGDSLTFSDPTGGFTAADLGLSQAAFTSVDPLSDSLRPKLTLETPLSAIPGLTLPLDSIRIRQTQGPTSTFRDVDLSSATTIDQLRNLIENNAPGTRVQVNAAGDGIDVLNEVAGLNVSIEEVAGGIDTATALGIRSLAATTAVADFNFGRGVRVVDGVVDPITGTIDPARNTDFRITLGNGQAFDVDLRPQDLTTVQSILDRINSQFTAAIGQPPVITSAPALVAGDFNATLTTGANGIALVQTVAGGPLKVEKLNNSAAAGDLGLLDGAYDSATSTFLAQDRATVRVNNIFSDLLDLRSALLANDSAGITVASERLTASADRMTLAHALVGGYSQRVTEATTRIQDVITFDTQSRMQLQDLDFAEAASRFSLLQTQLQASFQTAATFQNRTLLDFLG